MGFREKLDRMCVAADREANRLLSRHDAEGA